MLRQATLLAARQAAARRVLAQPAQPVQQFVRAFGAVTKHEPETAVARPFPGASKSEPEMEYIEEPSMLYMTALVASPWIFSFWFLTKFV